MKIVRQSDRPLTPASHEDPQRPGVLKRVLATRDDLLRGHVQMVNWAVLPVGRSFRLHYHEDMQEVFVIINGTVAVTVNGTEHLLVEGDAILIEPSEIHQMTNRCDEDVNYLVVGISLETGGRTIVCSADAEPASPERR